MKHSQRLRLYLLALFVVFAVHCESTVQDGQEGSLVSSIDLSELRAKAQALGDQEEYSSAGLAYSRLADHYIEAMQEDEAIDMYKAAASMFEAGGFLKTVVLVHGKIAEMCHELGELEGETMAYEAIARVASQLDDESWAQEIHAKLAGMYLKQGKWEAAAVAYELGKCHVDAALLYGGEATRLKQAMNYKGALVLYKRAAKACLAAEAFVNLGFVFEMMADTYRAQGHMTLAELALKASIKAYASKESTVNVWIASEKLAEFYVLAGQTEEAVNVWQQAVEFFERQGMSSYAGGAYCEMARVHAKQGEMEAAAVAYRQGIEKYKEAGDETSVRGLYKALVQVYEDRGDMEAAQAVSEEGHHVLHAMQRQQQLDQSA